MNFITKLPMSKLDELDALGMVCHKGGGGGGGNSGKVSWPSYLQDRHNIWLQNNDGKDMDSAIDALYNQSPYIGLAVYSPEDELAATQARFAEYKALLPSDAAVEWDEQVDAAAAKAAELADLSTDGQDALVDEFDERQMMQTRRAMARLAGMLADVGAVNGSAFALGVAMIQHEHDRGVSQYRTELAEQARRDRVQFVQAGAAAIAAGRHSQLEQFRMAAHMMAEINRIHIVAEREYDDKRIQVLVNDATWNLEIFKYAGNLLAAVQGGTAGEVSGTGGGLMSSLGGALSGGASGAMLGSMAMPGIGTALGGVLGGAAGFLGSR